MKLSLLGLNSKYIWIAFLMIWPFWKPQTASVYMPDAHTYPTRICFLQNTGKIWSTFLLIAQLILPKSRFSKHKSRREHLALILSIPFHSYIFQEDSIPHSQTKRSLIPNLFPFTFALPHCHNGLSCMGFFFNFYSFFFLILPYEMLCTFKAPVPRATIWGYMMLSHCWS